MTNPDAAPRARKWSEGIIGEIEQDIMQGRKMKLESKLGDDPEAWSIKEDDITTGTAKEKIEAVYNLARDYDRAVLFAAYLRGLPGIFIYPKEKTLDAVFETYEQTKKVIEQGRNVK